MKVIMNDDLLTVWGINSSESKCDSDVSVSEEIGKTKVVIDMIIENASHATQSTVCKAGIMLG